MPSIIDVELIFFEISQGLDESVPPPHLEACCDDGIMIKPCYITEEVFYAEQNIFSIKVALKGWEFCVKEH